MKGVRNRLIFASGWQAKAAAVLQVFAVVFLGFSILIILSTPFYLQKLEASAFQSRAKEIAKVPDLMNLNAYEKIMEMHPLFGKKKEAEKVAIVSACDTFVSKYSIAGIVQGGMNEAVLKGKGGKQTSIVRAGDTLDGVTVVKVKTNGIVVRCSEDEQKEILIEEF